MFQTQFSKEDYYHERNVPTFHPCAKRTNTDTKPTPLQPLPESDQDRYQRGKSPMKQDLSQSYLTQPRSNVKLTSCNHDTVSKDSLQRQLQELAQEVERLNFIILNKTHDLARVQSATVQNLSAASLQSELDRERREKHVLLQQLQDINQNYLQVAQSTAISQLQATLNDRGETLKRKPNQNTIQGKITVLEDEKIKQQKEVQEYVAQLEKEFHKYQATWAKQNSMLQDQVKVKDRGLVEALEKLKVSEMEKNNALKKILELESSDQKIKDLKLQSEADSLRRQVKDYEYKTNLLIADNDRYMMSTNERLNKSHDSSHKMEQEIIQYRSTIGKQKLEISKLNQRITSLLSQQSDLQSEIEQLQTQFIERQEKTNTRLHQNNSEQRINQQIEYLQNQVEEKENQIRLNSEKYEKQIQQLQASPRGGQKYEQIIHSYQDQIEQLEEQNLILRSDNANLESRIQHLEQRIESLGKDQKTRKDRNTSPDTPVLGGEFHRSNQSQTITQLQADLILKTEYITALNKEISMLKLKYENAQISMNSYEQEFAKQTELLYERQREIEYLREKVNETRGTGPSPLKQSEAFPSRGSNLRLQQDNLSNYLPTYDQF